MISDIAHAAWDAVKANRLRTVLTVGSVAVGVCSVVVMSSLARSGLVSLSSGLEALGGARLVAVFPKRPEGPRARYGHPLTTADLDALAGRVPFTSWIAGQSSQGERTVEGDGRRASADLVAGNEALPTMLRLQIDAGRPLTAVDQQGTPRVALVARKVAVDLFSSTERALGQIIRVESRRYTVVGVFAPAARFGVDFGFDGDAMVLVPLGQGEGQIRLDQLVLGTVAKERNGVVASVVRNILENRHHQADDFRVFDFAVAMDNYQDMMRTLELLAGAIAGVALLAGAAGTTNVLLVSAHEQVRQIGVRKALGASAQVIVQQFVLQGALIAAFGAAVGVAAGLAGLFAAGAMVARSHPGWVTVMSPRPIGIAVISAFIVTAIASLFPAWKVSRLTIVEALRARG